MHEDQLIFVSAMENRALVSLQLQAPNPEDFMNVIKNSPTSKTKLEGEGGSSNFTLPPPPPSLPGSEGVCSVEGGGAADAGMIVSDDTDGAEYECKGSTNEASAGAMVRWVHLRVLKTMIMT